MSDKRFGVRRKDGLDAGIGQDERLDAEPVAGKPQRAVPRVEIGEGEHPIGGERRFARTPMVERLEENPGVARAAKLHALPLEVPAEFAMVMVMISPL